MRDEMLHRVLSRVLLICSCLLGGALCAAPAAEPLARQHYIWFTAGKPTGSQTVTVYPNHHRSVHFTFNDRGRGPDTTTEIGLDASGRLVRFSVTGVNYAKGAVSEHFEVRAGKASWRSSLERGEVPARRQQTYLPVEQPPEYRAVLARALLSQQNRQLELLPAGSVRIEQVQTLDGAIGGKPGKAILYALSGLDINPRYVWLDENEELVGYTEGWFAVLRNDWSEHLSKLKTAQEAALTRYIHSQAKRFRKEINRPIAIVNARVLDVEAGRLMPPATVLIREGRIVDVGTAVTVPRDAYKLDAGGKTLMPSLWDMHGHIGQDDYLNYIASGVLNVRDMGNDPVYLVQMRKQIAAGTLASPDVHPMGFIDKRGQFAAPTGRLAQTLEEARGFIHAYAKEQHVGIKLYSSIEPAWVPQLTSEARSLGLKVAGHIPAFMSPAQAIHEGYTEVTHINMIMLQLIGDGTIDTRTPQRFIVPGERGGQIELDSKETNAFLDLMAERGIAHDPTLSIFMDQYCARPGEIAPSADAFADHLPPSLRREQLSGVGYSHGREEAFRRTGDKALSLIKRLHDRGVRILPGTDVSSLPGFVLVTELQYYARAGIANEDVLRLATIGSAKHLGREGELGSVAVGKKAYLLLVDGDPTQDLAALRGVVHVIKGNAIFHSQDILQAQGIRSFHPDDVAGKRRACGHNAAAVSNMATSMYGAPMLLA